MKIWANTIVHNEENFIFFSLMSVVDFVDKILVWDTGSDDKTVEIIEEVKKIKGNKISFKQMGKADANEFTKLRQQMLEESDSDWILVLDGDEIWWKESIKKVVNAINQNEEKIEGIVIPMVVAVGDIYHLQDMNAGKYNILGLKGHYNLRAISKKIPGLHVDLPYGSEGYFDLSKKLIQERERIIFLEAPYFHATHLKRSSVKRMNKYKYELGRHVPSSFKFPEVFYGHYSEKIASPWQKRSINDSLISGFFTPLRKLKRKIK